jgi:hypothetical protein
MDSQVDKLKVIFLPFFLVPGHLIPLVDTARLFARHGVSVTIITTTANALLFQRAIDCDANSGHQINTHVSNSLQPKLASLKALKTTTP